MGFWHCFLKHGTSLDVISFPGYKNGICWSLITLATYLESEGLLFWTNLTVISGPRHCWNIWGWLKMSNYSLKYPSKFRKKKLNILPNQRCFDWIIFITQPLGSSTPSTYSPLPVFLSSPHIFGAPRLARQFRAHGVDLKLMGFRWMVDGFFHGCFMGL